MKCLNVELIVLYVVLQFSVTFNSSVMQHKELRSYGNLLSVMCVNMCDVCGVLLLQYIVSVW